MAATGLPAEPGKGAPGSSLAAHSVAGASVRERPREASKRLAEDGLLHVQGVLPRAVAEALHGHVDAQLSARRAAGGSQWFGDVYGYGDSGCRWDLKLALTAEVCTALKELLGTLQGTLEAEQSPWELTELAAMCTVPGDPGQPVHADSSHVYDSRIVTIFVALHDIHDRQGPTRMFPRTHADGELHMGLKTLDEKSGVLCTMSCGDCVMMDSRLLHCGTANTSPDHRYMFYTSWALVGQGSRGSTNTLLDAYRGRLPLADWRAWTTDAPLVELPAEPTAGGSLPHSDEPGPASAQPPKRRRRGRRRAATASAAAEEATAAPAKRRRLAFGDSVGRQAEVFTAWLREAHDVDLAACGVEIRASGRHGLGAFARRRIHPGETLARIPAAAVLHAGKVHATDFGQQVLAALGIGVAEVPPSAGRAVTIAPEELLWLYMAWGRHEPHACPWFGYLQGLPQQDPLAWSTDDGALRWMEGTPLPESARREVERQRRRYDAVVGALEKSNPKAFPASRFTFDAWLWARSCYVSRAFRRQSFPSDFLLPGWESDLLCPVLDAFNHRPRAQVEWRFGEGSAAFMLPLIAAPYEAGDELFNLYGPGMGNERLLPEYGFALPKNPHDTVQEVVFSVPADRASERLRQLLDAGMEGLEAELEGGKMRVRLPQELRREPLETPQALLRAASLLALGQDYDEAEASCDEKRDAARAVAAALRQMLRGTAPLAGLARRAALAAKGGRRLKGRFLRCRARRAGGGGEEEVPSPKTDAERFAAMYARGQRQILREVMSCAEGEAEMAEMAAQMERAGDGGEEDGEEDPSGAASEQEAA